MYTMTLTPNRDPGPAPTIKLVTYEREGSAVVAIRRTWYLWPDKWAMVSYERLSPDQLYREHVGPTIRTTTCLQLIADGLLKPADGKRARQAVQLLARQLRRARRLRRRLAVQLDMTMVPAGEGHRTRHHSTSGIAAEGVSDADSGCER